MLAAKLLLRNGGIKPSFISGKQTFEETRRLFMSHGKNFAKTKAIAKSPTLKEMLMAPTTGLPISLGQGVAVGTSLCAIGGLCYYGMGFSNKGSALKTQAYWPEIVRDRINTTYKYFGGGVLIATASAVAAFRSKAFMNFSTKSPQLAIGLFISSIASMITCHVLPYREEFGEKQAAFTVFSVLEGLSIAPLLAKHGGPLMIRAACYTAGIVGGLSTLAVCAPSDKFLYMGAPLFMGLGVVFAASIGSIFFPAATVIGAGLNSISVYGGLVVFGGYVLHDTQRIIRGAQVTDYEKHGHTGYDPVNMALSIYLDTLVIFKSMVEILISKKKK